MQKPTKPWVEARLRVWLDRLGLGDWRISIDWDSPADKDCWAQVARSLDYDQATMYMGKGWRKRSRADLDITLCHEALHLTMRDLSRANDFTLAALEDNVQANNVAVAAWKRAEEGIIDRLSRALVASYDETL